MKTLSDENVWTPDQVKIKELEEQLNNAVDIIRRYVTSLGTILVENNGTIVFDANSTMKLDGQRVDFQVTQLEGDLIELSLVVNGKPWKEQEQITEESNEE